VLTTIELVRRLPVQRERIAGVVIAIGVNDTQRARQPAARHEVWRKDYRTLLTLVREKFGSNIVLCTIFPVEPGKPLGDNYFDPAAIAEFNKDIRKFARDEKVGIADVEREFRSRQVPAGGYTTDGVHLTPAGYELWSKAIADAAAASRGSRSLL